ncbi:MAG TPA: trigger factor [Acidobacteriota bacterium]|nr:trigger factor [Acidobacteriota bacterium]
MKVQVESQDVSQVKKKLTVEIPSQEAQKEYNRIVGQFRGMAALPGFRRGRAPSGLIKRRFKEDIEGELYQKLVPQAYDEAVKEQDLHPISEPQIADVEYEEGGPLKFTASLEVLPQFKTPEHSGLKVAAPPVEVSEGDIDEEVQRIREQMASLVAVEERGVEQDDYATIVLKGWYLEEGQDQPEDEAEPDIHDESVVVQVGDDRTHPAFTRALVGLKEGDEEAFQVEYEADYADQNLAGRKLAYEILVTEIKEKQLPEVDDDFVKDLDVEGVENLEQLRETIRERLAERKEQEREESIHSSLAQHLIDGTSFEVPDSLVEERIDQRIQQVAYNIQRQGMDPRTAQIDWRAVRRDLQPESEKDVRLALILNQIAEDEGIEISQEDLEEEIAKMAEASQQPVEKVRQNLRGSDGSFEGFKERLLRRRAMKQVYESAEISEEKE